MLGGKQTQNRGKTTARGGQSGSFGAIGADICPLRVATLALLLMPLVKAVVEASEIAHGARPLTELIHRAGFWALIFLRLTLAVRLSGKSCATAASSTCDECLA
jgi:hypothetical protein